MKGCSKPLCGLSVALCIKFPSPQKACSPTMNLKNPPRLSCYENLLTQINPWRPVSYSKPAFYLLSLCPAASAVPSSTVSGTALPDAALQLCREPSVKPGQVVFSGGGRVRACLSASLPAVKWIGSSQRGTDLSTVTDPRTLFSTL